MHIGIYHTINDAKKWEQGVQGVMSKIEGGTLPAGMKPVSFIPVKNQKIAFCVWEADSVEIVKNVIDHALGAAARNEYFEVDTANAIGLPGVTAQK